MRALRVPDEEDFGAGALRGGAGDLRGHVAGAGARAAEEVAGDVGGVAGGWVLVGRVGSQELEVPVEYEWTTVNRYILINTLEDISPPQDRIQRSNQRPAQHRPDISRLSSPPGVDDNGIRTLALLEVVPRAAGELPAAPLVDFRTAGGGAERPFVGVVDGSLEELCGGFVGAWDGDGGRGGSGRY